MGYWIYDILVVALLALFVFLGWRKGLLLSLCGFAVVIVSFLCAGFLADTLDEPVADLFAPKLTEQIEEQFTSYTALHHDDQDPRSFSDALRDMGGLYAWAGDTLDETLKSAGQELGETLHDAAELAARTVSVKIAHSVVFGVSFLILFVLLTLLLHALDLVARLPGLSFCNGLGGGIIGLLKGVIILYVVIVCLRLFSGLITPEVEENTRILSFFLRFDLVSTLF